MISFFWTLTIATIFILLLRIIIKKDFFSLNTFILIGVYLPLLMSELNWSDLHVENKPLVYYGVFLIFDIFALLTSLLPQKNVNFEKKRIRANKKRIPIEIYNIIYIVAILLENYYVSGYFVPTFHSIDVHTARMPYIYFLTTGVFFFSAMNLYEYISTKKIRYLFYILLLLAINIVTKSARIDAFICVVQLVSLFLAYYLFNDDLKKNKTHRKPMSKKSIIISCLIVVFAINIGLKVGNNRMNSYGRYDLSYADGILYKGPMKDNDLLVYYYGYFPLSFDNLAYNIEHAPIKQNYIGLSTFRTFYFGLLQFDNFLGLDGGSASRANIIRSKAAAVATGFWDFYYDYKDFFGIPIFISFAVYCILKMKTNNGSIASYTIYFYWIPLWMFLSFDNRIYDYQVLIHIILLLLIIPKRYYIENNE